MVMLDMFKKGGYRIGVAHCNFKLRGDESDGDEKFVQEVAHQSKLPFYSKSFNTRKWATEQSVSIQMAARELRMEWFSSLCQQEGYDCIALAHHQDDQHETFFINLMRGSGIAGLRGIQPRSGMLAAALPLLSVMPIWTWLPSLKSIIFPLRGLPPLVRTALKAASDP